MSAPEVYSCHLCDFKSISDFKFRKHRKVHVGLGGGATPKPIPTVLAIVKKDEIDIDEPKLEEEEQPAVRPKSTRVKKRKLAFDEISHPAADASKKPKSEAVDSTPGKFSDPKRSRLASMLNYAYYNVEMDLALVVQARVVTFEFGGPF